MGVGDTFVATPVGVFFGPDGEKAPGKTVPDPYFGGAGPDAHRLHRVRLLHDGLPLRRQEHLGQELPRVWRKRAGAEVHSDDDRHRLRAAARRVVGGPHRAHRPAGRASRRRRSPRRTWSLAAGTYGTQKLLFKMRDKGKLPRLSDKLGVLTRTNSESIVGAGRFEVTRDLDLTHGVAITSSIHPDLRHAYRAGAIWQGVQRDGAVADPDDRRCGTAGHRRSAGSSSSTRRVRIRAT